MVGHKELCHAVVDVIVISGSCGAKEHASSVIKNRKSWFPIFDHPTKSGEARGFVLAGNVVSGHADLVKAHFLAIVYPGM